MQKNCAHCGNSFSFQRNTRRYCSDNCKQLAYFSRNGFTPAHGSVTKSVSTGFRAHEEEFVTVKDVKHVTHSGLKNDKNHKNNTVDVHELEKVMEYAKCLIRNLLHLSGYQYQSVLLFWNLQLHGYSLFAGVLSKEQSHIFRTTRLCRN